LPSSSWPNQAQVNAANRRWRRVIASYEACMVVVRDIRRQLPPLCRENISHCVLDRGKHECVIPAWRIETWRAGEDVVDKPHYLFQMYYRTDRCNCNCMTTTSTSVTGLQHIASVIQRLPENLLVYTRMPRPYVQGCLQRRASAFDCSITRLVARALAVVSGQLPLVRRQQ
jgi:hypothetical protein